MSYAQKWLLAVAMKRPYPMETGATTEATQSIATNGDIPFQPFCKGLCYRVVTTPCKCPCKCPTSNKADEAGALSAQDQQTQRSALVMSGAVAALGLIGGWFLS